MNAERYLPFDRARTGYPSRVWLFILAFLIQAASLSQLPFLQENILAKVGLSVAELAVFGMFVWTMRRTPRLGRWLALALGFVVIRFVYAWLIGYLRYDSSFVGALQEGRFGPLIAIAPVAFLFFRHMTVHKIGEVATGLTVALAVAALLVTWFFVRTGYVSIADRGATRYVMSVVPLVVFIWVRMIVSIRSGEAPYYRDLGFLVVALLNIVLFSTSRTEAILCGAVIAQWVYVRVPHLRWPLLAFIVGLVYIAYASIQPTADTQIAGRDYRLALAYSRDAFPFGVGLVPEALQKIQLGTAGNFFASDYGPILLIYRYGLVGITMGVTLLIFWIQFFLQTLRIPGTFIVAFATLAYFLVVPLLDYGSMIGGLLLGAMAAVMASAPREQGRSLRPTARDLSPILRIISQ